ncbi:MAG: hypothetical protein R3E79_61880 [Caldilineaceae bacterium]
MSSFMEKSIVTEQTNHVPLPDKQVTIEQVRRDPEVITFIRCANETLRTLGTRNMVSVMLGWSVILPPIFWND